MDCRQEAVAIDWPGGRSIWREAEIPAWIAQILTYSLSVSLEKHLRKDGRLLLFYSTLSQELGLTSTPLESIIESYGLRVSDKLEAGYIDKLEAKDPLALYKQRSKIQLLEVRHPARWCYRSCSWCLLCLNLRGSSDAAATLTLQAALWKAHAINPGTAVELSLSQSSHLWSSEST